MNIEAPTHIEWDIIVLAGWFVLHYKFPIIYWLKFVFIRPFIPKITGYPMNHKISRNLWTSTSITKRKPFSCYACMVLWLSIIVSFAIDYPIKEIIVHTLAAFLTASLIQNQIEK